jgi:DNA modification methylase
MMEWTEPNDSILDFSCGSGTNGVAAKMLYLSFDGLDINPQHVKIAWDRIAETKVSSLRDGREQAIKEIMVPYHRLKKWAPKVAERDLTAAGQRKDV